MTRGKERQGGIERKILSSILMVGIIPMTLASIMGYVVAHEGQRKAVEHTLATVAEKTAEGLMIAFESRLRTTRTLSQDPEVISILLPGMENTGEGLERLRLRLRNVSENADDGPSIFTLYDAAGMPLISTTEAREKDRTRPKWMGRVRETYFYDFEYLPDENRYAALVVAPIFAPGTTKCIGYLCEVQGVNSLLKFSLAHNASRNRDKASTEGYQVVYVSENRATVSYLADTTVDPPSLVFDEVDSRLMKRLSQPTGAESGALRVTDYKSGGKSVDVLLAYQRMTSRDKAYRVYIVVYRHARQVFVNLNSGVAAAILGCSVLVGLFCILAYRSVHNNIVRPVALLNEGAQIIRQGDLDLKLKINTGDEIEELAISFNKMALAMSENIRHIEESEEKYRNLLNSMPDGVYQADSTGVILFINPTGAEIFGFETVGEALGANIRDLFLEEGDFQRLAKLLSSQHFVERTRTWMKRRDGRAICVEISANRVLSEDNTSVGVEGLFRDITMGVRLEQQARERSERIAAINQIANVINSSLEAGRLYESLVGELRKVVHFEYASIALLNDRGDAFELRALWPECDGEVHPCPFQGEQNCAAWMALHQGCLLVDELQRDQLPFGDSFPSNTRSYLCVPLYASGHIIGTLNLGSDISEAFSKHDVEVLEQMSPHVAVAIRNGQLLENLQQSLDEVMRAREKLHEANEELKTLDEMKTNLLSNVSHELRTPLVSILGYTDMIINEKAGPISPLQRDYLNISVRNIEKLVTLIENLLDFSRLHRGTEELVFDAFDLVDCARTSIQIIKPVADSREIEVKVISSEEQILVEGDKGKMGQVFNNLLSNAVKFNHNGGAVTIEILLKTEYVDVICTDTGIGIPKEALDKVFTRFYQYDGSSTRKYGGTGIGLSIAQDIVRLHGSRITVTSELGKGTVFRFALPLPTSIRGDAGDGVQLPTPTETHLLVLLVSRDRALSTQVRTMLTTEGLDLVHGAGAGHAISLAKKHHPDCIIVDAEGIREGEELLDTLLADPDASTIPLILLSNDDDLYRRYTNKVASRVKRGFRKSSFLSGIHYALTRGETQASPLGARVMCVDDDPEILTFMSRLLETEGYAVDCCGSGKDALEKAGSRDYCLVLLDIAMPDLDGWETCHRLHENPLLAGIKVCLVTAKPVDRSALRFRESGADGYLLKPFKAEDLLAMVQGFDTPRANRMV